MGARQQKIERNELLFGQQHGEGKHDTTAAAAAGIVEIEGQNDSYGLRSLWTALQVSEEHTAGQGKQISAVDPVETQGRGGISNGPANLEGRTARGAAEADGTTRFGRRKCNCGAPIKR